MAVRGDETAWELVLPDGARVPLASTVTIGRASDNDVTLSDRTVSRYHARVELWPDGPLVTDTGSSHGTFVDGKRAGRLTPLPDGSRLRIGELELSVERVRASAEAGRTMIVQAGATALHQAIEAARAGATATDDGGTGDATGEAAPAHTTSSTQFGFRPRLRSGWALKRLEASEGDKRYVLKDLRSGKFVRMAEDEAQLFELLDGTRSLVDLIAEAERLQGPNGPSRLAGLLADLGDRGFLAGVDTAEVEAVAPVHGWRRLTQTREYTVPWAASFVETVYRSGGRLLFTRPVALALTAIMIFGVVTFGLLIQNRYGTPFVVANRIGLGGLVFILGRFALVFVHELAHGLAVVWCGRRVHRAGVKVMAVFPYGFVDTSDAWFEPRRRRLVITGSGPICDFTLAGIFAILALFLDPGTVRDIFFQLAFAGYVGSFTNLNPFLDRDGYQLLVDVMREPGLRGRARLWLKERLAGRDGGVEAPRALRIYWLLSIGWMVLGALFVLLMASRYYDLMVAIAPQKWMVTAAFVALGLVVFLPVLLMLAKGLRERRAEGRTHAAT